MASRVSYTGLTGAQTDFSIPFEYLSAAHIRATIGGTSVPFIFLNKYLIRISPAPTGSLVVARVTPSTTTINDYVDGSILAANDLDTSFFQNLFISQELQDVVGAYDLNIASKADAVHTHDASAIVSGQFPNERITSLDAAKLTGFVDVARLPVITGSVQEVSSGDLTVLTTAQKNNIVKGAIVTTTDGRRWLYTGSGDRSVEASYILISDVTPEWTTVSGKPTTFDATPSSVENVLGSRASKATPADNDAIPMVDSAASGALKKTLWSSIKATLKSYFDTLYLGISGGTLTGDLTIRASGTPTLVIKSTNPGVGENVLISLDPSGNGVNARDAQIRGTSTGGETLVGMEFYTSAADIPRRQLAISPTGVADFRLRPTYNGQGLALLSEVSGGTTQVPWYTPEQFGAVGDGSTDDGPSFQNMLNSLPTSGCIVLMTRSYRSDARALVLSGKHGVRFLGSPGSASTEGTWLKFTGNIAADRFTLIGCNATTFDGVGMYCPDNTAGSYFFMLCINGSNTRIHMCTFSCPKDASKRIGGVWFMNGNRLRMNDSRFVNIGGRACLLQSNINPWSTDRGSGGHNPDILETERNIFSGIDGDLQTTGVFCGGNGGSYLDNGNAYLFLEYGFVADAVSNGTTYKSSFFWLRSKGYETIQKDAIRLNSGAQAIITGLYAGQSDQTTQNADGCGIVIPSSFTGVVVISACEIRGQKRHGINSQCDNVTITGCYITECNTSGQANTYGVNISGTGLLVTGNNFNNLNPPTSLPATTRDINCIPTSGQEAKAVVSGNMTPRGVRHSSGVVVSGNAGSALVV